MVSPHDLTGDLRRDLQEWNDGYTDTGGVSPDLYQRPPDWDELSWRERGEVLAQRLQRELGPDVEVTIKLWG